MAAFAELEQLQDRFNSTVAIDWREKDFEWNRAAWLECAELIEGTGCWKWWKGHGVPSLPQTRLEVVDVLHFLLSWAMVCDSHGPSKVFSNALAEILASVDRKTDEVVDWKNVIECAEDVAKHCAAWSIIPALKAYGELMASVRMDMTTIRTLYVSKNALNTFRARNGYKEGTYIKTWNDLEDNQHLEAVMASQPTLGFDQIIEQMQKIYPNETSSVTQG